jgi:hypothetical protein
MDKGGPCEEVLDNIKNSLLHCKDNVSTYDLAKSINIRNCENIGKYQSSLHATKTNIIIKTPDMVSNYSIKYKVNERIIFVE